MEKTEIQIGGEYGLRETPNPGVDLQHVKVLEHVRGSKWRVEWIDPNPGLVDFVSSRNVIVPWKQRKAFLRDERNAEALRVVVEEQFPGKDSPIEMAVGTILETAGERDLSSWDGILYFQPDALERVAARAGIEPPTHRAGYRDRLGQHYLPFTCALELAHAFAAAEPRTVLDYVDAHEREMALRAREPGASHMARMLAEWRAHWALIRQWAGHDVAVAMREERIAELEQLLVRTMWELRRPGVDPERVAARLGRVIRA